MPRFCADLAVRGTEPLLGSARDATGFVFISWPRRLWERKELESRHLPAGWVDFLHRLKAARGVLPRLINKPGMRDDACTLFLMPENVRYDEVDIGSVAEVLDTHYFGVASGRGPSARPVVGTVIFCCTHGARDRCCAKFGYAAVQEMRRLATERKAAIEIWESTHVTGDRFAANAIVLPSGDVYGWLRAETVAATLAAILAGRRHLPHFRGNSWLEEAHQLVEALAVEHGREQGYPDCAVHFDSSRDDGDTRKSISVTLTSRNQQAAVGHFQLIKQLYDIVDDCRDYAIGRRNLHPRWILQSVEWQ